MAPEEGLSQDTDPNNGNEESVHNSTDIAGGLFYYLIPWGGVVGRVRIKSSAIRPVVLATKGSTALRSTRPQTNDK